MAGTDRVFGSSDVPYYGRIGGRIRVRKFLWNPRAADRHSLTSFGRLAWRILSLGVTPGRARGPLAAWQAWELLANRLWPKTEIPKAPYGLLSLRLSPYRGSPLLLPDGTLIRDGFLVGELHCNNQAILSLVASGRKNPFAACREDLRRLASWLEEVDKERAIRAICGFTILVKAARRLGFVPRNPEMGLRRRFEKFYMTGLLILYSIQGSRRVFQGSTPTTLPCEVWMSRDELLRRYGPRQRDEARQNASLELCD